MEGKKVIFIAGTSYSGSTLLDMILANDPKGFSCGEIIHLFDPFWPEHFDHVCGCGDVKCDVWRRVLKNGADKLHDTIFEIYPDISFITDSSKDPYWIYWRTKELSKKNIQVKNLLIWKTPLELAHSFRKRNRTIDSTEFWESYHRLYFTLIKDWMAVKYSDFVQKRESLEKICEYLGIPYYSSKYQYWDKKHHTKFENISLKINLFEPDYGNYKRLEKK